MKKYLKTGGRRVSVKGEKESSSFKTTTAESKNKDSENENNDSSVVSLAI